MSCRLLRCEVAGEVVAALVAVSCRCGCINVFVAGGESEPVDLTLVEILSSSARPLSGVVAGVVMTVWLGVAVVEVVLGGTVGLRAGEAGG